MSSSHVLRLLRPGRLAGAICGFRPSVHHHLCHAARQSDAVHTEVPKTPSARTGYCTGGANLPNALGTRLGPVATCSPSTNNLIPTKPTSREPTPRQQLKDVPLAPRKSLGPPDEPATVWRSRPATPVSCAPWQRRGNRSPYRRQPHPTGSSAHASRHFRVKDESRVSVMTTYFPSWCHARMVFWLHGAPLLAGDDLLGDHLPTVGADADQPVREA